MVAVSWTCLIAAAAERRPNVILIMTDDQGWGDVGFHDNPRIETPNLDALAKQSLELTRFYVCPVCSPTRASLMTGRYNYRTGAIDTYLGRSTMVAEEVTLAEMLADAGYKTAIFGKWHLGDNYPSRAMDQGFGESFVHRGGGMVQPADPPGGSYFDPILMHNGQDEPTRGYCSDVFTDAAARFVEENKADPFFIYLAFNCPHGPLQLPDEYYQRYQGKGLPDNVARVYGMVTNIDDNLGRLFGQLEALHLENDTIVIFLTDNGPAHPGYNGVFRDRKGSVHEGGIRTACLLRWPGHFAAGGKCEQVAAHIDLTPTLLEACGVEKPADVQFDGVSLLPAIDGRGEQLKPRNLFFQWHRGDQPERYRACAARGPRFKLVNAEGRGDRSLAQPRWALYDLDTDPGEKHNVIDQHSQEVEALKQAYDRWFDDVSGTRGYPVPRIIAGTQHENPVTLTRQDWRGPQASWDTDGVGTWDVDFATAGKYDVTVRMPAVEGKSTARVRIGELEKAIPLETGATSATFPGVELSIGTARVQGTVQSDGNEVGVHYVDLDWLRAGR
jgi:arylsulfatase A-like enzyme